MTYKVASANMKWKNDQLYATASSSLSYAPPLLSGSELDAPEINNHN